MIKNFLKSFGRREILSGTLVVTVGVFIGSIFSYLLQVFLGRLLTIVDYGIFNALLSVSVILAVFGSSLTTSLIKTVSDLKVSNNYEKLTQLFWNISMALAFLGALIGILILLFIPLISKFLHIKDNLLIYAFAFTMALSFLSIVASAYLQGLLRFKAFAFWTSCAAFLRMSFPLIAVVFGYGVVGVFFGIGASSILAYLISILLLNKNFTAFRKVNLKPLYKKILSFMSVVLFIQIGMTLLNNIDVILVKHYFSDETAGLYAGVVTLGKVLLFGAGTVGVVMFPQISAAYSKKDDYLKKFKPFLLLQLVIVGLGTICFVFFPKLITMIMFGKRFLPSAEYLPLFSIFIGLYVLVNFMLLFFLATENTRVLWFLLPGVAAQIILLNIFNSTLVSIITVNVIITGIILVLLLGYFVRNFNIRSR